MEYIIDKNTNQHFVKLVLPFSFPPEQIMETQSKLEKGTLKIKYPDKDTKVIPIWEKYEDKEVSSFFLPHVRTFLTESDSNNYLLRRKLTQEALNKIFGFFGKDDLLIAELNNFSSKFRIKEVELYLFYSGIGYVILECDLADPNIQEILDFAYYMKYATEYSPEITFDTGGFHEKKIAYLKENQTANDLMLMNSDFPSLLKQLHTYSIFEGSVQFDRKIKLLDLFRAILICTFNNIQDINTRLIGENLLVFSFINTAPLIEEERCHILYNLRRLYKESYQAVNEDLALSNEEIIETFENVKFGIALEGSTVLVEDTGHPFYKQLGSRVKRGYFVIYLLAHHNRAACINFRTLTQKIIPVNIKGFELNKRFLRDIRELRNRILSFYLNSYFVLVSNSTLYSRVYEGYINKFRVKDLLQEVKIKTDELDELLTSILERNSNRLINNLTFLGAIFVPLSIILGVLGINIRRKDEYSGDQMLFDWEHILVPSAVVILLYFVLYLINIWFRRRKRRRCNW
ncbi:MAG: CorA family divalent cation transporter [Bacteroidales bacterium]|nr:CorA family divalent cation transporter [Bacteroidales bacterium]